MTGDVLMIKPDHIMKIETLSQEYEDLIKDWRRHLHEYPELSFKEFNTSSFIVDKLEEIGCQVTKEVAGTGVIGLLDTKRPGRVIAFRADMDALPVSEEANEPFSSKNPGVMHACGHDAHMAIMLGLAKVLSECLDEMCGAVKFIFQPGEEANGGARLMIDAGALENPHVEVIYALHMIPEIAAGMVGVREGYMTATDDEVTIRVFGSSAHSSAPNEGVNAITAAAHMITTMQTVITESLSPHDVAVFSICTINGGDALNVIPDYAEMTGMLRCVEKSKKRLLAERLKQVCEGVAQAFGGKVEVDIKEGFPAVNNDRMYTKILTKCAEEVIDPAVIIMIQNPHMGSEDFSYYQEVIPGVMFMLGSKPSDGNGGSLHSPDLRICEDSLLIGVRIFAALALRLCG